jgi:hypothetical protein
MNWTIDSCWTADKQPMLTLRDDKGHPHALVMEDKEYGEGYAAVIITNDMPARSGFRRPIAAVLWVESWVQKHLYPGAKFGPVPDFKVRERHARQADERRGVDRRPG